MNKSLGNICSTCTHIIMASCESGTTWAQMRPLSTPECARRVHVACKCTFQPSGPLLDSDVAKIHELLLQLIRDENAAEAAGLAAFD